MPSEALEALRRLAARVSQAPTTARSPDIVKFEGSTGSGVSTTPNPVEKHGFLGVPPGTPDENVRGSRDSSEPETVAPGTPGTPTENLMGSIPDGSKEAVFQRLDDTGTIRTPGTHENNKGGNEIESDADLTALRRPHQANRWRAMSSHSVTGSAVTPASPVPSAPAPFRIVTEDSTICATDAAWRPTTISPNRSAARRDRRRHNR
jgi:hypothetical protein